MQGSDTAAAEQLLSRGRDVYAFARAVPALYTTADLNSTLLYNSTSFYDDLAWAAGWLYKATREEVRI